MTASRATNTLSVQQADFPADIARCLPEDCSDCLLLAGYPQGQLGPVLAEFIRRGGYMLCTTVEESLFTQMHEDYEKDPSILRQGIKTLAEKKTGECFEVELRPYPPGIRARHDPVLQLSVQCQTAAARIARTQRLL